MATPQILYCTCAHTQLVPPGEQTQLRTILGQIPDRVTCISDLCGYVARKSPELWTWAETDNLHIIACYPRSVIQLFAAAGIVLDPTRVTLINPRTTTPQAIAAQLGLDPNPSGIPPLASPPIVDAAAPWFPVIDRTRCVDCKQCLNFCFFDTYTETADGRVEVSQPLNCKLNCPACARICPEAAIIFPKYPEAPINGENISDETAVKEQIKVNVEEILGNDIYAALARRKARSKRKLIRTNLDPARADAERTHYLGNLSEPVVFRPTIPPPTTHSEEEN